MVIVSTFFNIITNHKNKRHQRSISNSSMVLELNFKRFYRTQINQQLVWLLLYRVLLIFLRHFVKQ